MDNLPILIEEARAILHRDKPGQACHARKENYSMERKCSRCDKPIYNRNKSGFCRDCSRKENGKKNCAPCREYPSSDIIQFEPGKGLKSYRCWYCKKVFYTNNIGIRLCSGTCRGKLYSTENAQAFDGRAWLNREPRVLP